jgi:putative tryptophan/tyrosine transport system substrate-binding protein
MRRRTFIAGAAAWPVIVRAQQPATPVIGLLGGRPGQPSLAAFRKGLAETGYVEGRNVAIEYRWVLDRNDQLPVLVRELINRGVAVIAATTSTAAALAAKRATQTIPIVFRIGGDPVAAGLVASLNRPGGNITGSTTIGVELGPKRLQILRELVPAGATVALLSNPTNANAATEIREIQAAAHLLGVRLLVLDAVSASDLDAALARLARQDVGGLLTAADPFIIAQRNQFIALAARRAIPAIYSNRLEYDAGGLMFYGTDGNDGHRLAGTYVGRILKGEKPADLPVQQSTKVELAINLKIARILGITIPTALLVRADEVIE